MARPYFIHVRRIQTTQANGHREILVKGGTTIAVVGDQDNGFRYGVAVCSIKDNYCKSTGRQLSTGRAFEKKTSMSLPDDIKCMADAEKYLRHHYTV